MPWKAICILLPVSLLLMGCFTQSSITKDESPPDDRKVLFHLLDGSHITSSSGNHHRFDNGYQINGEVVRDGIIQQKFEGVLHDNEIDKVTVEKFNTAGTVVLVAGAALLCVGIFQLSHMQLVGGF